MLEYADHIMRRREEILARVDAALARAGRRRDEVELVAVSKTVGVDEVLAAIQAGYRVFGENRPQELGRKLAGLAELDGLPPVRFDMIGNLQTNKINAVLGRVALIHSISSLHLARAVSQRAERARQAGTLASPQDILVEVNVSGEATKSGFDSAELFAVADELSELRGIRIRGLMTMAPRGDTERARATFSGLRELRDKLAVAHPELDLGELSCGMSEDFEAALLEGSTIIRLGRVVFDPAFTLK